VQHSQRNPQCALNVDIVENVWPAPSATYGPPRLQGVLSKSAADQSASTYQASEVSSRALRAALPGRTEALPLARHPLRLGDLSGRHLWQQPHARLNLLPPLLQFDEPEDDVPVPLAGPGLDFDQALPPIVLHRP
jgi:hypothetical protein